MEIIQLEAFERVARDGSFTRAAESLNISQPAISTRIAHLEAELGVKLFERQGRGLYLTQSGQEFLPYARRILAVMAESIYAIQAVRDGETGEVKFAAPTPFLLSYVVDVLEAFRSSHPGVNIMIRERNKTTIFELINDHMMTLGLVNAPVYDRQFQILARFHDPIRAVVAAGHPLASKPELHMRDLYGYMVYRVSLFPEMSAFVDELVERIQQMTGQGRVAIPMVMARRLVLSGCGVTFLPESYVKQAVDDGQLALLNIVDMPQLWSQPMLIAHRDREIGGVEQAFIDTLLNHWRHLSVK